MRDHHGAVPHHLQHHLGLRSVNPGLLNLFRLNKATRWQTLRRLRIPSALPYFFGGLRISAGWR
jgi:NitT/TauT family transport system permease protein